MSTTWVLTKGKRALRAVTLESDALLLLLLLLLFQTRPWRNSVYVNRVLANCCKGALDNEELFVIEGSKNWRSTPGQTGGAKNAEKTAKNPFTAATTSTAASRVPFSVAQLECPLSPATTESEALPLYKRRCMITRT